MYCMNFKKSLLFLAGWLLTVTVFSQEISKNIVIDQFGYRPQATKIAVIRNPKAGYDKNQSFAPGTTYQVVDASSKKSVFEGELTYVTSGENDVNYGDEVWWFDFSPVTADGTYYVFDVEKQLRSYSFKIADDVYNSVLKDAVRVLFYQRAGCEKNEKYAGTEWWDDASHIGPLQDKECRLYNQKKDASTERDVHGGWYDAGDYNKYTVWGCNYVETLLDAYLANPDVWTDDYNIPESGNGVPDLLDEVKWELDWILRMQEDDGSVLSVVNLGGQSPPSYSTAQTFYGPATTNASYAAAKAFAIGCKVYKEFDVKYSNTLKAAAESAWKWAEANPSKEFYNSQNSVAAGEQEGGAEVRLIQRLNASLYLYEITGNQDYLNVFETKYKEVPMFKWYGYIDQYRSQDQYMFLRYLNMENVSSSVKNDIRNEFELALQRDSKALFEKKIGNDAYRSFVMHYNWGSNLHKCTYGTTDYLFAKNGIGNLDSAVFMESAEDYIHYIHGVNPFAMVYLTNMNQRGASNSVNQMYHSWFCNGSELWDEVGTSTFGPAPGYLIGGAYGYSENDKINTYTWDGCCDNNGCGSAWNNSLCNKEYLFEATEPYAKRYNDFNDGWPVNSWQITEPSCGYQVGYISLLSKFVAAKRNEGPSNAVQNTENIHISVYPNPADDVLFVETENTDYKDVKLFDLQSRQIKSIATERSIVRVDLQDVPAGIYVLQIFSQGNILVRQIVVK